MKAGEYYAEDPKVMQVVRLGQELISACENGELFQATMTNRMNYGMQLSLQVIE